MKYENGNAEIEILNDGTRIINYENNLQLDYPLNLDIRVSTKCSFGYNPLTQKAFCDFCHESAKTDGIECNYSILKEKLVELPIPIEIAIGSNELTDNLLEFLSWCLNRNLICNLTVNQGHLLRDKEKILYGISNNLIKGIGVSYRSSLKWTIPQEILNYENTIFHVICGIDNIEEIINLSNLGVKKILILGEKNFGFNINKVDLNSKKHREWFWFVRKLFDIFDVVSFDNLAIEQLNIRRFFPEKEWNTFYQGEHSFYINAVEGYYSPSSRSLIRTNWNNISIKDYFHEKQ